MGTTKLPHKYIWVILVPNDVEIELQTVSKRCCLLSITGCEGLTLYSPRLPRHPCKIRMCCDLSQLEH
ncbi:hypothetical protein X975_11438, partial [Stegodyphus mimosarum]